MERSKSNKNDFGSITNIFSVEKNWKIYRKNWSIFDFAMWALSTNCVPSQSAFRRSTSKILKALCKSPCFRLPIFDRNMIIHKFKNENFEESCNKNIQNNWNLNCLWHSNEFLSPSTHSKFELVREFIWRKNY